MKFLTWESFEGFLDHPLAVVDDSGPFRRPTKSIKVQRTKHGAIRIRALSERTSVRDPRFPQRPAGTVRRNDDCASVKGAGWKILLRGLSEPRELPRWEGDFEEESHVWNVEGAAEDAVAPAQTTEWIANANVQQFILPALMTEDSTTSYTRSFPGQDAVFGQAQTFTGHSSSWNALFVQVSGVHFTFIPNEKSKRKAPWSARLIYAGAPSDESRTRVRQVLSLMIGRPLVYFGFEQRDVDHQCVAFEARSAYSGGGSWYAIQSMPPAPLTEKANGVRLDGKLVNRFLTGVLDNYERFDLNTALHFYLNALAAPVTLAASHFGSAIEALRNAYEEAHPDAYIKSLMNRGDAERAKTAWQEVVAALDIDVGVKSELVAKASQLNSASIRTRNMRFLQALNLESNELEQKAWMRRNSAAHGELAGDEEMVELVREIKILRGLFHRILLRMTNASDEYIDYHSLGFPSRQLGEATQPLT